MSEPPPLVIAARVCVAAAGHVLDLITVLRGDRSDSLALLGLDGHQYVPLMIPSHEFTMDQLDAAIDFVTSNGAEDRGQTISYARVFQAAGLPNPQNLHESGESHRVTEFMAAFHHRCQERQLPPLDALVVHVAGSRAGFPGVGYFRVNGKADPRGERVAPEAQVASTRFWEMQREECKRWGIKSRRGQL
ncbi:hypothetical protein AB0B39_20700 [Micromonospora sp. NPDC049114]|uniref:hypothetical protein n=1 Tax=Micromonospora sp. NPDC049114 TaxID=3155498 RepID=UPI0033E6F89D